MLELTLKSLSFQRQNVTASFPCLKMPWSPPIPRIKPKHHKMAHHAFSTISLSYCVFPASLSASFPSLHIFTLNENQANHHLRIPFCPHQTPRDGLSLFFPNKLLLNLQELASNITFSMKAFCEAELVLPSFLP